MLSTSVTLGGGACSIDRACRSGDFCVDDTRLDGGSWRLRERVEPPGPVGVGAPPTPPIERILGPRGDIGMPIFTTEEEEDDNGTEDWDGTTEGPETCTGGLVGNDEEEAMADDDDDEKEEEDEEDEKGAYEEREGAGAESDENAPEGSRCMTAGELASCAVNGAAAATADSSGGGAEADGSGGSETRSGDPLEELEAPGLFLNPAAPAAANRATAVAVRSDRCGLASALEHPEALE